MRKGVFTAAVVAVVVAIPLVAFGAETSWWKFGPADLHAVRSGGGNTTASTSWHIMGGWGPSDGLIVTTKGPMSITVSAQVTGAPIDIGLRADPFPAGGSLSTFQPNRVRFDPQGGTNSFSFTFVRSFAKGQYEISVWWSSPTGATATVDHMTLDAIYQGT